MTVNSEIYEVSLRMDKVMRTPEQVAKRIENINLLIEQAHRYEVNDEAIQALEDSKLDEESKELTSFQVKELQDLIHVTGLDVCGIGEFPGGLYASNTINPTEVYYGVKLLRPRGA